MSSFLNLVASAERRLARMQGKGWGTSTITAEVSRALQLLDGKPPALFIDIGGNKGLYAQDVIRCAPDCEVVIFEPARSNINHMRTVFSGNTRVTLENSAVSNVTGPATLYSDCDGSGLASLSKRDLDHFGIAFERTEDVQTIRFEDYWTKTLARRDIDLCKIDIEGHELAALEGFGAAICQTRVIQFEFGGCNIDTRTYFRDFWHFFGDHGFELFRIAPRALMPITRYRESEEHFSTTNFLAKRR